MSGDASAGATPADDVADREQTTLDEFRGRAAPEAPGSDVDDRLGAVVDLLDRQMDVLEAVAEAASAESTDGPDVSDGDDESTDHAGRGIW